MFPRLPGFFCLLLLPWLLFCLHAKAMSPDPADPAWLNDLAGYVRLPPQTRLPRARSMHEAMVQAYNLNQLTDSMGYSQLLLQVKGLPVPVLRQLLIQSAILHLQAGSRGSAKELLDEAVRITEEEGGRHDPDLILPVALQGMLLHRAGQYAESRDRLHFSQHLIHRDFGVYAREQLPVLSMLTSSWLESQGLFSPRAELARQFMLDIQERHLGRASPQLVPQLLEAADWYNSILCFEKAEQSQLRALRILEDAYGPDDFRLIEPLLHLSRTRLKLRAAGYFGYFAMEGEHRRLLQEAGPGITGNPPKSPRDCRYRLATPSGFTLRPARRAVQRALSIARTGGEAANAQLVQVLVATGDLLTASSLREARDYYREAWQQLTLAGDISLRDSYFASPRLIFPEKVEGMSWASADAPPDAKPSVVVSFDISERGQVRNLQVIESSVDRGSENLLRDVMSRFRYRPRLAEGEVVQTSGILVRQLYNLRPSPAPAITAGGR